MTTAPAPAAAVTTPGAGGGRRPLTYLVATTLDGFIAGSDGADPTSFWPITPDYLEHVRTHHPDTLPAGAREALGITGPPQVFDTVVEGRGSYEVGVAAGVTDAYPHLRHLVVSTSLVLPEGTDLEVVRTDPVARVRELKAEPGLGLWLVGGGALAAELVDEIDHLVLKVAPLTLGAGIPLWGTAARSEPRRWRPTGRTELPSGVVVCSYVPAV